MTGDLSLMDRIEARIDSGQIELPPANQTSARLRTVTADPDFDIQEVVQLVGSDQALTAEVLRVANGAFYGGLSEIRTVADATVRLGAAEIARLAALAAEKANYTARNPALQAKMPDLWNHSVGAAMGAKWLAAKLGFKDLVNEVFIGGLLHDVGALLMVRIIDDIVDTIAAFHADGIDVVVHCHGGRSRTGLALRAWLMRTAGLTEAAATTEAIHRWPHTATWNQSFTDALQQWET